MLASICPLHYGRWTILGHYGHAPMLASAFKLIGGLRTSTALNQKTAQESTNAFMLMGFLRESLPALPGAPRTAIPRREGLDACDVAR